MEECNRRDSSERNVHTPGQYFRNVSTGINQLLSLVDAKYPSMGDLIGFEGYLNESTPFNTHEWDVQWKGDRRYHDFNIGSDYNDTCDFPRMWSEDGFPVGQDVASQFTGCFNGDFDQVG